MYCPRSPDRTGWKKRKAKLRRQRRISLHQLRKKGCSTGLCLWSAAAPRKRYIGSEEPLVPSTTLETARWHRKGFTANLTGGAGENREHSAPATATPPTSKARHPSQFLPDQRHAHLVEVQYCEDTRPKNQLEASKQQHCDLSRHLSRASAKVTLHTIFLGVGGVIYPPRTLKPFKELGLDTYKATRLAWKLYAHSVKYAYRLAGTRRALEVTSFDSHQQDQARATASNPPDHH
eukprot:1159636-Pelagomonas_calceolata.AAC.7